MFRVAFPAGFGRFARLAIAAASLPYVLATAPAAADPIVVKLDQATVVTISKPAATVIVGNPAIADATILDQQMLIITGRGYGTTNLFVLDANGKRITNQLVSVIEATERSVIVHRRVARQTFACAPTCAPSLAVGDTTDRFDAINKQLQQRQSLASTPAQD